MINFPLSARFLVRSTCASASGAATLLSAACVAWAAGPGDAHGTWLTAAQDGVIEFRSCDDQPTALCGHLVWDKDAGTSRDNCGLLVAQFKRFDGEAWREGWVFDPRDNKKYKGVLRVKGTDLYLRAYVGSEVLGQTEQMTPVATLPTSPTCKKS